MTEQILNTEIQDTQVPEGYVSKEEYEKLKSHADGLQKGISAERKKATSTAEIDVDAIKKDVYEQVQNEQAAVKLKEQYGDFQENEAYKSYKEKYPSMKPAELIKLAGLEADHANKAKAGFPGNAGVEINFDPETSKSVTMEEYGRLAVASSGYHASPDAVKAFIDLEKRISSGQVQIQK